MENFRWLWWLMIVDVNLKSEPFLKVEQFEIVYANINSSGNSTQLIECEIAAIVSMSFKFRCRQLLLHLLLIRRRKKFTRKPNQKKSLNWLAFRFASVSFHFLRFYFLFKFLFCALSSSTIDEELRASVYVNFSVSIAKRNQNLKAQVETCKEQQKQRRQQQEIKFNFETRLVGEKQLNSTRVILTWKIKFEACAMCVRASVWSVCRSVDLIMHETLWMRLRLGFRCFSLHHLMRASDANFVLKVPKQSALDPKFLSSKI